MPIQEDPGRYPEAFEYEVVDKDTNTKLKMRGGFTLDVSAIDASTIDASAFPIASQTPCTDPDGDDDTLLIHDDSEAENRSVTPNVLVDCMQPTIDIAGTPTRVPLGAGIVERGSDVDGEYGLLADGFEIRDKDYIDARAGSGLTIPTAAADQTLNNTTTPAPTAINVGQIVNVVWTRSSSGTTTMKAPATGTYLIMASRGYQTGDPSQAIYPGVAATGHLAYDPGSIVSGGATLGTMAYSAGFTYSAHMVFWRLA